MAKGGVTYEEFEPFCEWKRLDHSDVLQVHLPEFKKEELKVRISNSTLLTVSGERQTAINNDAKKLKFNREFKLSKEIYPDQIRAKFGSNVLSITMPKKAPADVGKPEADVSEAKPTAYTDNGNPMKFISSRLSKLKLSKEMATAMAVGALILAFGAYYLTKI